MMTKFSKTMHGCVTAAVMALSVPAMAGERSQAVSYGDLDLSSIVGQNRFETRIKSAIKQVCGYPNAFSLAEKADQRRCMTNAMEQARPKMAQTVAGYQDTNRLVANATSAVVGN